MSAICRAPAQWQDSDNLQIFDHFWSEALASLSYATTLTDSGSVTVGDAHGGIIALVPSDGTVGDNDEAGLYTINEVFKIQAGKPMRCGALLQFSEANTDDANVFFGFASAFGANLLVDDGAGPRTSGNVVGIYKVDGGTVWRCVTRYGSTTSVTDSVSTTTAGGSSYQLLEVNIIDQGSVGSVQVTFTVNGETLRDSNGNPIVHQFPVASATEMQFGAYVKNGGANLETLNIDKWYATTVS
jgi:hypothetical protein